MITLTREEAQQVLDALEKVTKQMLSARDELGERGGRPVTNTHHQDIWDRASEAYTDQAIPAAETLRARLSAPEPEEKKYTEESCPVCGYYCLGKGGVNCIDKPKLCGINTAPPQREWQGLTDEEIRNEAKNHVFDESFFSGAVWARGQIMGRNDG